MPFLSFGTTTAIGSVAFTATTAVAGSTARKTKLVKMDVGFYWERVGVMAAVVCRA